MVADRLRFTVGVVLLAGFAAVLAAFLSPIFGGQNGLNYLDNLYNSISKGSAYYIPGAKQQSAEFVGRSVSVTLTMADAEQAEQTIGLFEAGGAQTQTGAAELGVSGDLGRILERCLTDADAMYHNDGAAVADTYGYDERRVLYNWWCALKEMEKHLKKQSLFREADVVAAVRKKAVETSYNYYTIEPESITNKLGIVVFSLVFYVIYTMWYGFGFMYVFEGWGMRLDH